MGFFASLKNAFGIKSMDSSVSGSFPASLYPFEYETSSGQLVDSWSALKQSTVLQCVTVLMNGVSQIPFNLMQKKGRSRSNADKHPLYWLFKEKPNPWQSSVEFWNMVMIHLALQGEIVIWKIRVRGQIHDLIPFPPGKFTTTEEYVGGWAVKKYYLMKDDGSTVVVPEEDIWHLRWREYGLRMALPQMSAVREVVGIALAGDKQTGTSFKNKSSIQGIIHAKQMMTAEQKKEFQENWERVYGGVENTGKSVVVGMDIDFTPLTNNNRDSQFVEQRKLQIEEICRCWNVNPLFVFSDENGSSYNAREQAVIQHLTFTMAPWYRMIEESAYVNLLTEDERRNNGLYFAFNDAALLRTDTKSRADFYQKLINTGVMTPNEAREKEDLPPLEGGDKLYVQGAMVPIEQAGQQQQPPKPQTTEGSPSDKPSDQNNQDTGGDTNV